MKILLREWGDEVYVWKDATYETNGFRIDDSIIQECNIVSILDDNRKRYFKCSKCGEVFRKGSAQWKKHIEAVTDTSRCFDCKYLTEQNLNITKQKYTKLPDGRYSTVKHGDCKLMCTKQWYTYGIDEPAARENCQYNQCTRATQNAITDIFTDYEGVFDDIITIDQVVKNGYTEMYDKQYKLKAKNTIWANTNSLNIVDSFDVSYRSYGWKVFYSKKYDELFMIGNRGKYNIFRSYNLPDTARENIKAKIASLYKTEE